MQVRDTEPCGSRYRDLTGRRFGRLVVLERAGKRTSDGCYYWLCKCDCGNTTVTSSNKLLQGVTKSCGCYRKERLRDSHSYVAGTCVEIIRSKKLNARNTSGIRNVSFSRGRWLAKISFARRQFFLGRYRDIATAAAVVRAAEQLRDEVIEDAERLGDRAVDVLAERLAALTDRSGRESSLAGFADGAESVTRDAPTEIVPYAASAEIVPLAAPAEIVPSAVPATEEDD